MVSSRQRQANRANAKRSTGPRTAEGKARASRNAKWHGLATPVAAHPVFQEEIVELVRAILESCGPGANLELATQVAEAQVDLHRVRRARHQLINRALEERPPAADWQLALGGEFDFSPLLNLLDGRGTRTPMMRERTMSRALEVQAESSEEREARTGRYRKGTASARSV